NFWPKKVTTSQSAKRLQESTKAAKREQLLKVRLKRQKRNRKQKRNKKSKTINRKKRRRLQQVWMSLQLQRQENWPVKKASIWQAFKPPIHLAASVRKMWRRQVKDRNSQHHKRQLNKRQVRHRKNHIAVSGCPVVVKRSPSVWSKRSIRQPC